MIFEIYLGVKIVFQHFRMENHRRSPNILLERYNKEREKIKHNQLRKQVHETQKLQPSDLKELNFKEEKRPLFENSNNDHNEYHCNYGMILYLW